MFPRTRREFLGTVAASVFAGAVSGPTASLRRLLAASGPHPFRIRTITAGVELADRKNLRPVESALAALNRAKAMFVDQGFEVQTIRITTSPFVAGLSSDSRVAALADLKALDAMIDGHGALLSIGPVMTGDQGDPLLAEWTAALINDTRRLSASVVVASPDRGVHSHAVKVAADTILALARTTPAGLGNFRFAAAANIPPGTPFFPVGYHNGPASLALGLESPSLVESALASANDPTDAAMQLRRAMEEFLLPLEQTMEAFARREGRAYLGIDTSPAPGMDRSIGAALESLIRAPFGSASTLAACAAVTEALKSLTIRSCGYCGLMLPVLEDPVLAQRANEGRYGLEELLLFSSVCGTGLDVVPIPGDTPPEVTRRVVLDVASLSAKLMKPLSARLFPVPGKAAGEMTSFADPLLTNSKVFSVM